MGGFLNGLVVLGMSVMLGGVASAQTRTQTTGPAVVAVTVPEGTPVVGPGTSTAGSLLGRRGQVLVPVARGTFQDGVAPAGYRAAWDDGRLNPQRGPRTVQGDYQSQGVWTNTTPRRERDVVYIRR